MKTQELYDLRERFAFCSGTDLHEFVRCELGEPSPSGNCEIDAEKARVFVKERLEHMALHNGKTLDGLYTKEEQEALRTF